MANDLFNRYGGNINNQRGTFNNNNNNNENIISQLLMNPGAILDIMFQNDKINIQQYNDLQQYKNNPQAIFQYLLNNGKSTELRRAEIIASQVKNK